tara:strand:+ start:39 stop:371 length:333 start_codon:yes stop_codon:yes gene_type:complete
MDELTKYERNGNALEISLEGFTPEEILVAKSILGIKAIHGTVARLQNIQVTFIHERNNDMADYVGKARGFLRNIAGETEELAKEYAERLDISRERFEEIHNHIYTIETKL